MEQNQKKCRKCKKDLLDGTKIPLCQSCRDEMMEKAKKGGGLLLSAGLTVGFLAKKIILRKK